MAYLASSLHFGRARKHKQADNSRKREGRRGLEQCRPGGQENAPLATGGEQGPQR